MATSKFIPGLNEYMRLLIRIKKLKTKAEILNQYKKNESDNYHTENIVLLAQKFGTPVQKVAAKKAFLQLENSNTGSSETTRKIQRQINSALYPKLNKPTMATKTKAPAKRKTTAKKKTPRKLPKEAIKKFKEAVYRLPHGYEVVKVSAKKKKSAAKKTTAKKKLVKKKVATKKTVAKKRIAKKASPKQMAARAKFAKMAKARAKSSKKNS